MTGKINNILDLSFFAEENYSDRVSHKTKKNGSVETKTFKDTASAVKILTAGFAKYGIKCGDHIVFFVNNRFEWIVTDFAIMALRAVSVPRGSDTAPTEVKFIYNHSDSRFLILETVSQLVELTLVFKDEDWERAEKIFIIDSGSLNDVDAQLSKRVVFYDSLMKEGQIEYEKNPDFVDNSRSEISSSDLLTIVYTSGTTGNPKGVMLTHGSFVQNVIANTPRLEIDPSKGETTVVMLPSWHVYERAFEYCGFFAGVTVVYSSPKNFAADLKAEKPQILISVPRVWESIYQKLIKTLSKMPAFKRYLIFTFIKINQLYLSSGTYLKGGYVSLKKRSPVKKAGGYIINVVVFFLTIPGHSLAYKLFKPFRASVGGRLRGATSAAGALPKYLDELFNSIGITLINAYGMTECAPGILSRTFGTNTFGTIGIPFDNVKVEIRKDDGSITEIGEKGIIFTTGPQLMTGYYKNQEATDKVLGKDGWLNTGDIGIETENGEIIIVGRAKDTIVLMGGENVEPEPIEDKMKESLYIDHAVLLGQDRKQLTALIAINEEELMNLAGELKVADYEISTEGEDSIEHDKIYSVLMKEVSSLISRDHGFKSFERISKILAVRNNFSIGKELTQTMKVKRKYIVDKYQSLIEKLHKDTRG
ncbi:MAG: AMP-binding protein [Spirochaetaceae bacterium]|nr:AMP-binding protein [Spirochaetaceae bacterium]